MASIEASIEAQLVTPPSGPDWSPSTRPSVVAASREIRAATHAAPRDTVLVYQAYSEAIAASASAANSFAAPLALGLWSANRTSWVKPSAVWMGYRCGWGLLKDRNQVGALRRGEVESQTSFEGLHDAKGLPLVCFLIDCC
jgi:hypothetical protein